MESRVMSSLASLARSVVVGVLLSAAALAQNQWTCPDDGKVTVVTNTGTGNVTYTFKMSSLSQYDTSLQIVVFSSTTDPETIHQTIPWTYGTDPSITIGPGQSIRIEDPQDEDTKYGHGTYSIA
jgi:hypothetical protein